MSGRCPHRPSGTIARGYDSGVGSRPTARLPAAGTATPQFFSKRKPTPRTVAM